VHGALLGWGVRELQHDAVAVEFTHDSVNRRLAGNVRALVG
jgi:hypothetical protein